MSTPESKAGRGTPRQGPRYGMVVDLNRCVGCQTCTIACKHHNDTPPGVQWRSVLDVEQGEYPNVERLFLVTGCQHCAEPPCVPVCPTGATRQRADGLVTMDYDTCIGCGYCAVACPYQARTIAHEREWYYGTPSRQEEHVFHEDRVGVATKCTFCVDKIDDAAQSGAVPGLDLEHTPACAASCIAQALHFGDFADPDSNVSRLAQENAHFQMHAELGTDPQIRYLYEVPETTPGRDPETADDDAPSVPNDPLAGGRQTFWDVRAALNFILGGMSSGLAVASFAAWALGGIPGAALPWFFAAAAAGMGVGLLFVFAEIGRQARFLYVLRRPQSSWMTRETYAVAVFYPAVAADLFWPSPVLHAVVAVAAAAFLYCQGRILHAGKGIPAWRHRLIPRMLVASGLYEGTALAVLGVGALALAGGYELAQWPTLFALSGLAGAGALLAVANAALFRAFRRSAPSEGVGPASRRDLDAIAGRMRWMGHLVPGVLLAVAPFVLLIALLAAIPGTQCVMDAEDGWRCTITLLAAELGAPGALLGFVVGSVCVIAGGALWKHTLVTRACHQQGFALPRLPQRGSGTRAAPARFGLA
ncbi:MAG: 4Fe-4S dicluster domain-containing protein [Immundisolibacterales bacterium]|nr:4Fe-4S dicluster domain-containing protein [Immundisolibacterales bacterium]